MRSKVKHSKVRNTGLLFEFLLRQITADVLNKRDNSKAAHMIKKRFNERTELGKELALYNILINKKFNSDKKADYFINEVVSEKRKLNNSTLKREKYNLIKELKEEFILLLFFVVTCSTKLKCDSVFSAGDIFLYSNNLYTEA